MYNEDFLNRMATKASRDKSVFIYTHKRQVVVTSVKTGERAVAKCHKDDKWNFAIGVGIAYCRLKNIPIKKNKINENLSIYRIGEDDLYFLYIGNNLYFKVKPNDSNNFWKVIPYEKVRVMADRTCWIYHDKKQEFKLIDKKPILLFSYCPPHDILKSLGVNTLRDSKYTTTFKLPFIEIRNEKTNRMILFRPLDKLTEIENVGYGWCQLEDYKGMISMSHSIFIYEDKYYEWYYDERTEEIVSVKK